MKLYKLMTVGILCIILGTINLFLTLSKIYIYCQPWEGKLHIGLFSLLLLIQTFYIILFYTLGIFTIKRKIIATKIALALSIFLLVVNVPNLLGNFVLRGTIYGLTQDIFFIILALFILYFYSRPQIKEQLK